MSNAEKGQVIKSAAEVYDEFYLPALFGAWGPRVVAAAAVKAGNRVLDVACGTGVAARAAAEVVGSGGSIVGLDVNEGMLDVARQHSTVIEWRAGHAESLPFDDNSFDAVLSQFGLMFFEDRIKALQEMYRVLKPGGKMAVAVWDTLENTPGYADVVAILQRLFGEDYANGLRAPYVLGNTTELKALFDDAGIVGAQIDTQPYEATFPSIEDWMFTDVKGWVLADMLDDTQYAHLLAEAEKSLARHLTEDGRVVFSAPAHIVTAQKPS